MTCITPRSWRAVLAIAAGAALAGCGRFGFDALSDDIAPTGPSSETPSIQNDAGAFASEPSSLAEGGVVIAGEDASIADGGMQGSDGDGGRPFTTPPRDSCMWVADALACANFNKDGWPDYMSAQTSNGDLDTSQGTLDATSNATNGFARLGSRFSPIGSGTLYMRMRILIPWDADLTFVSFAELDDENLGDTGIDLSFRNDELEVYSRETDDSFIASGFRIPRREWFCFRAEVDLGDADGAVRTFIDDTQLHDTTGVDTLPATGISETSFGIVRASNSQNRTEVLIDDFALSTSPLTDCP